MGRAALTGLGPGECAPWYVWPPFAPLLVLTGGFGVLEGCAQPPLCHLPSSGLRCVETGGNSDVQFHVLSVP